MSDIIVTEQQFALATQLIDDAGSLTPYSLIKLVNAATDSSLKPQYAYQLARLGSLKTTNESCEHCGSSAKRVVRESAIRFLAKSIAKNAEKQNA